MLAAYGIADDALERMSGGWTNDTFHVRGPDELVLQRVSNEYFEDVLAVMENLVRVTGHLEWKRQLHHRDAGPSEPWYRILRVTADGRPFELDSNGSVWRAFDFAQGTASEGQIEMNTIASIAGLYGRFLADVDDLEGPPLIDTVADFHDLDRVIGLFEHWRGMTTDHRLDDIDAVMAQVDQAVTQIEALTAADGFDRLPNRVVHNDTKLSNVLVREGGEAHVVLDLDLVMSGYAFGDFGDLVRSASRSRLADPGAPFSVELFHRVLSAFVEACGAVLSDHEVASFALAGPRICVELGIRYLTDHLRDEPRLRLAEPGGSLERGRQNIALARQMLDGLDEVRGIVDGYVLQAGG